jgi:predicted secreted protein
MKISFAIVVYVCIWFMTLFAVLPFGVRTQDEAGEVEPGTPGSAPAKMRFWRIFAINSAVAAVCFSVFWVGYHQGWLTAVEVNAPKL